MFGFVMSSSTGQLHSRFKKGRFFKKKAQPTGFHWVLGFIGFFGFFYLNEQFESLLVDLAHQLNFYLDLTVL